MKLNFGCGSIQPDGWCNVDREDFGQEYDSLGDFGDNEFDMAVAHCSLQINTHDQLDGVLSDLYHAMKPAGTLRISLPDIHAGFDAYRRGDIKWFPNGEPNLDDRFSNWLTWYSTTRILLTPVAIANRLHAAGFPVTTLVDYRITSHHDQSIIDLDTRDGECFFIEATK